MIKRKAIYGLLAEFEKPEELLEAARHTHDAGYTAMDAFTPLPIEGLADAVGFHGTESSDCCFYWRIARLPYGILSAVLRECGELPVERRGQALQ